MKFFIKKYYEKCGLKTSSRYNFQRILCKKESEEVSVLIWTNFGSFAKKYNKSILLQKFHFPIEVVLNSLQTRKGLELVFGPQFSYNLLMKFFLL